MKDFVCYSQKILTQCPTDGERTRELNPGQADPLPRRHQNQPFRTMLFENYLRMGSPFSQP